MTVKSRLTLLVPLFFIAASVEAAPLHCVGSQGAECAAGRCESQETRVDLTVDRRAHRADLCIGESCYAGSLRLATAAGAIDGDFSGRDLHKQVFGAHLTLNTKRDAATITWGDGEWVAMAFAKCERARQ
jgi:hypothetical protein